MGLNLVPSGQDGVTVTVTPGDPATIRWPAASPTYVRVSASGGAARFSMRSNAAPDSSGVVVVPDGQSVTVGTKVEATPIVVRVATDASVTVTVEGFRDVETGVSSSYPVVTPPTSGASKLSDLTDVDKTGATPGKVLAVSTTSGGVVTGWGVVSPVTGGSGAVSSVAGKVGDVTLSKSDVGLNNVNNTADANKPISGATQAALDLKAAASDARFTDQRVPSDLSVTNPKVADDAAISLDKTVDGTTNKTFTATEKTKLGTVASGATANATDAALRDRTTHAGEQPQSSVTGLSDALALKAPLASPAFTGTPTGITKAHVGLGNVDNTTDLAKPVSTAQQAELDAKSASWGIPFSIDPASIRGSDNQNNSANRGLWWRVRDGGSVSKIALVVGTQSGNVSVGFYNNSGSGRSAVPGAPIVVTGSVACPAAGYAELDLGGTFTVKAGDWIALAADNATATFRCGVSGVAIAASDLGKGRLYYKDGSFPLPSSAPASPVAAIGSPIVLVGT